MPGNLSETLAIRPNGKGFMIVCVSLAGENVVSTTMARPSQVNEYHKFPPIQTIVEAEQQLKVYNQMLEDRYKNTKRRKNEKDR